MTRYPREHKARTREAILGAAGPALRAQGLAGARVEDVMRGAGLTHGGFYSHFASKDELVAETCAAGAAEAGAMLRTVAEGAPRDRRVEAMLEAYLTPARRDAAGCTLATLAGELARQPHEVRERFTTALAAALEELAAVMPAGDDEARTDQAIVMVSAMVGAMMLSRAVSDPALSDRLLAVARRALPAAVHAAAR